jgi:hypothetical protein
MEREEGDRELIVWVCWVSSLGMMGGSKRERKRTEDRERRTERGG